MELQLVTFVLLILKVDCTKFYGATIRWRSDPAIAKKVTFYWKAGWEIGGGPCNTGCDSSKVGTFGNVENPGGVHNEYWKCQQGCTATADTGFQYPVTYWITTVCSIDNYEMGENEFHHTFDDVGPYYVGHRNKAWRTLNVAGIAAQPFWNVWTLVQLGQRSDTGRPNNSPLTAALPVFRLQFGCVGASIKLPALDPDGDTVKCRRGVTTEECADVCNALPNVAIDEDTCTLSVDTTTANGYTDGGWYVAAVILEDYPRVAMKLGTTDYTTADPMSKVPVQFLINVRSYSTTCNEKPSLVWPTPEPDEFYYIEPTGSVGINVYALNEDDATATIDDIVVITPPGTLVSELKDDDHGRARTKYKLVYWSPNADQFGPNAICFHAIDNKGKSSGLRCVYVFANDVDECSIQPCQNGGTCNNMDGIYTCDCLPGTDGYNCTLDTEDNCATIPCLNGATCTDDFNNYICTCVGGYTGQHCDTNINECASDPCFNDGTCTDGVNSFTCSCKAGYTGAICNQFTDECRSSPCQNGATCIDLMNSYICSCALGYQGTHCETDINECVSSPCVNGGTCNDGVNQFTCTCPAHYTSIFCDRQINYCSTNPCMNSGTCISEVGGYSCLCSVGYIGTDCESEIDECSSNPCNNNGTCTDALNSYTCMCAAGYTGVYCGRDINDCESSPCLNSGSCIDKVNGYTCSCVSGYTGIHCQTNINECSSNPCPHGTCTDGIDEFSCTCNTGYEGTLCDETINHCLSNPCSNGATCIPELNGYECLCAGLWTGVTCDQTDVEKCSCDDRSIWLAYTIQYNCSCSTSFLLDEFVSEISADKICWRNIFILGVMFILGINIPCLFSVFVWFISDLRTRHYILLHGGNPDRPNSHLITIDKTPSPPPDTVTAANQKLIMKPPKIDTKRWTRGTEKTTKQANRSRDKDVDEMRRNLKKATDLFNKPNPSRNKWV